jgi:hypothetical protein
MMKFFSWRLIGRSKIVWENHAFPASFMHPDHFKSLCGEKFGGLTGESKKESYCSDCADLAPIAEAKEQKKEDKRIAKLELKRSAMIEKINGVIIEMHIEALLDLYRNLKRNK